MRTEIEIKKGSKFNFFITLYLTYIVSNAVFVIFNTSSLRLGMIVGMIFLGLLVLAVNKSYLTLINKRFFINIIIFYLLVIIQTGLSLLIFGNQDLERALMSLILISLALTTSPLFVNIAKTVDEISFHKIIESVHTFLVIIGILSVLLQKFNIVMNKSMIIFFEPSHFALIYLPLLLYKTFSNEGKKIFLNIVVGLILALTLQNATLIFGVSVIFILKYWRAPKVVIGTSLLLLTIINSVGVDKFSYFSERFMVTSNLENLSVLVWLSGWERAYLSLMESYGIGVGFQQLGLVGSFGSFQNSIYEIMDGRYLNLFDGGAVAPKLIAETGIIGIFLLFIYILYFILIIRKLVKRQIKSHIDLFFSSVYIMFSVQLFFRGVGYFSPSVFIFFSSIYWLFHEYHILKKHHI